MEIAAIWQSGSLFQTNFIQIGYGLELIMRQKLDFTRWNVSKIKQIT